MENLRWENRYSDTEKPDEMGRWARILFYKGLLIAWVRLTNFNDKSAVYTGRTYFPVNGRDLPFEHFTAKTSEEAMKHVESLWQKFIDVIW